MRRDFAVPHENIAVIPNAVDAEALLAAEPFPTADTVVLSSGRLEPYKNVDRAIAALAQLDDRFVLKITGSGSAARELRECADRLGVTRRLELFGHTEPQILHRWLRTARVFVTMSAQEAFGIAALEALTAGAAVVASDIPAHRELAQTVGGPISLVPLDAEHAAIARAIRERADAERNAPARVPSWDDVARRTEGVYQAAAAQGTAPRATFGRLLSERVSR